MNRFVALSSALFACFSVSTALAFPVQGKMSCDSVKGTLDVEVRTSNLRLGGFEAWMLSFSGTIGARPEFFTGALYPVGTNREGADVLVFTDGGAAEASMWTSSGVQALVSFFRIIDMAGPSAKKTVSLGLYHPETGNAYSGEVGRRFRSEVGHGFRHLGRSFRTMSAGAS